MYVYRLILRSDELHAFLELQENYSKLEERHLELKEKHIRTEDEVSCMWHPTKVVYV